MKLLILLALSIHCGAATAAVPAKFQPLVIENRGQFPEGVRYQILHGSDALWITDDAVWMTKQGETGAVTLRARFEGGGPFDIRMTGHSATKVSYFRGNDPEGWHSEVPVYSGLKLQELYEGVDLEIATDRGELEWRWIVKRGGKAPHPGVIRIAGAEGATPAGDGLDLRTAAGSFTLRHPVAYDEWGVPMKGKARERAAGAAVLLRTRRTMAAPSESSWIR